MSEFFDDSLISDFVMESREHLDSIEPDLLGLEESGGDVPAEVINRIFRAIHSIKGGAGFLAYDSLKNLSHSMENVLMKLRDGEFTLSTDLIDVLLRGVDKLRAMVDDIQASEDVPCEEELAELAAIIESGGTGAKATSPKAGAAPPAVNPMEEFESCHDEVRQLLGHGRFVYVVEVHPKADLIANGATDALVENLGTLGDVLAVQGADSQVQDLEKALHQEESFKVLFSTVLEPSLATSALELPENQTTHVVESMLGGAPPAKEPAEEALAAAPAAEASGAEGQHKSQAVAETLRVRVDLLTRLMNSAGELVLARNQLLRALESQNQNQNIPGLSAILQNIDHVTTDVQEGIMQTRMQPIGAVFNKFPRVVRDIARALGKEIALKMEGAEVELDKSILESLSDPMTHLIRNCADHALEPPDERVAAGKNREGLIELWAYHEGGQVNISIRDDGRGIDAQKIAKRAVEKGVITKDQAASMSNKDLVHLIFAPGFSTAEVVSDVSGRGVGMDVVRSNIEKLGGTVNVETEVGHGTTVLLQLPLTLAIIPSLVVGVEDQRFAVPQVNVEEFVWVRAEEVAERIERLHGQDVLRLRGMLLPLVRLGDVLGLKRTFKDPDSNQKQLDRRDRIADRRSPDDEADGATPPKEALRDRTAARRYDWRNDYNVVVTKIGGNRFGLIVDRLYDTEEIVVKPLSCFLKQSTCFSGATILGDGCVITILDVSGVAETAQLQFADLEVEEKRRKEEQLKRDEAARLARRSLIIFNGNEDEYFAVTQDSVLRLEQVLPSDIRTVGNQEFLEYRGQGLPLIRLDHFLPVRSLPETCSELYMIIPRGGMDPESGQPAAGILASRIVDALDTEVHMQKSEKTAVGIQGTAIVNKQLTLFLDPEALVQTSGVAERSL